MRNASQLAFSQSIAGYPGHGVEPAGFPGSFTEGFRQGPRGGSTQWFSQGTPRGASLAEAWVLAGHGFASAFDIALPRAPAPVGARCTGARLALAGPMPIRRGFTGPAAVVKRAIDLVGGVILLLLALPLLLAVAAALWWEGAGPVLFVQSRIGRDGRPFACLKLRTMRVDAENRLAALLAASPSARREWAADQKLRRDPRVTPLGRLVRKLSLDELPQLANVIAGQMSLVGPRPIVQAEVPRYGAFLADYCAVKPGMTGMWQVSGRNDVSYGERVQLDRHYARHASLLLDLRIAWRTVPAVLGGAGCY